MGIFWIKGSPPRWGKKRDGGVGVGGVVGEGILFSRRYDSSLYLQLPLSLITVHETLVPKQKAYVNIISFSLQVRKINKVVNRLDEVTFFFLCCN